MTDIPSDLVLFHYTGSPYARRITAYLALRKIPYAECMQPVWLPRPDLTNLGVKSVSYTHLTLPTKRIV